MELIKVWIKFNGLSEVSVLYKLRIGTINQESDSARLYTRLNLEGALEGRFIAVYNVEDTLEDEPVFWPTSTIEWAFIDES